MMARAAARRGRRVMGNGVCNRALRAWNIGVPWPGFWKGHPAGLRFRRHRDRLAEIRLAGKERGTEPDRQRDTRGRLLRHHRCTRGSFRVELRAHGHRGQREPDEDRVGSHIHQRNFVAMNLSPTVSRRHSSVMIQRRFGRPVGRRGSPALTTNVPPVSAAVPAT